MESHKPFKLLQPQNLRSRSIPGPSEGICAITVTNEDRLNRHTRVEGTWLEGDEAGTIGTSAFREHHDLEVCFADVNPL